MSNFQIEPRPLFNQRRSRVCVMKDDVPDLSQISMDSSIDLSQSKHEKSFNFLLSPNATPPINKSISGKKSITFANATSSQKRKSTSKSLKNIDLPITVVYDGIEDKVKKFINIKFKSIINLFRF